MSNDEHKNVGDHDEIQDNSNNSQIRPTVEWYNAIYSIPKDHDFVLHIIVVHLVCLSLMFLEPLTRAIHHHTQYP